MKRYDTYTESGISWIGKIPSHWEMRKLSQLSLLHFKSNKDIQHQNLLSLSYGCIIRKDVNTTSGLLPASYNTYQIINEGNIVLRLTDLQNDKRSLRVGLCQEEGIITSAYLALEPRESVLPEYLYLLLHCADIKKVFYGMGNGLRQNLNWNELRRLEVVLPPQAEQEAIVAYLDEKCAQIDRYVTSLEERIERLGELRQALIAEAVTRGINPQAPLRPSGIPWLGKIPQHWEVKRLKSLLSTTYSGEWGNEPTTNNAYGCVRVADFNFNSNVVEFRDLPTHRSYSTKDIQEKQLKESDILLEKSGGGDKTPVGRVVLWSKGEGASPFMCANFIQVLRTKANEVSPKYLLLLLSTLHFKEGIRLFIRQTTGIQNLTLRSYLVQNLPVPPQEEQEAIVAYLDEKTTQIDRYTGQLEEMIRQMKDLRQTIISEAVTGKICVLPN